MRFACSSTAFALAALLAPSGIAHGQQCAEGRVSTPETLGRCCWPGQSFSETLGRCSGPPQCPPPFVAEGDSCLVPYTAGYGVPPEGWPSPEGPSLEDELSIPDTAVPRGPRPRAGASVVPRTRASIPSTPTQLRWPDEPASMDRAIISPRLERGIDEGLVTAGLSLFLGGYLGQLLLGAVDEAAGNCQRFTTGFEPSVGCGSWGYGFVPVVGGLLAGTVIEAEGACCRNVALGMLLGIPLLAVQLFGLTLTGIAVFGSTETIVPGARGGEPIVAILPYASDREAGTWLRVAL